MVADTTRLRAELDSMSLQTFGDKDGFNVRRMAHVINLAVKECMAHVHKNVQ